MRQYRCNSCSKEATIDETECPKCGGRVKQIDELIDDVKDSDYTDLISEEDEHDEV